MRPARDPSLAGLNDCGCCEGISKETPVQVNNAPGLTAIAYRVGTHSRFLESMLAALAHGLDTQDPQDPAVAFLDACATVDDVLTFYQERIANEVYLRTATERVSLVQLARQVGHEPRPGVAASVYLAFTIEDTPGTPERAPIPAGTRVQSIPGPNELPQTFETSTAITGRSTWNAMRVRSRQPQALSVTMTSAVIDGIDLGIKRGDRALVVAGTNASDRAALVVQSVDQDPTKSTTTVALAPPPGPSSAPQVYLTSKKSGTYIAGLNYTNQIYSQGAIDVHTDIYNVGSLYLHAVFNNPPIETTSGDNGLYIFRQRAGIFGHNAPKWADLPQVVVGKDSLIPGHLLADDDKEKAQYPDNWDNFSVRDSADIGATIDLDNVYSQMTAGTWVALEHSAGGTDVYHIEKAAETSRSDFAISAKVTRLTVDTNTRLTSYPMRKTTAFGQSERLALSLIEITSAVNGTTVVLDQYYPGLQTGQPVLIKGNLESLPSLRVSEVRTLVAVNVNGTLEPQTGRVFTELIFDVPLANSYMRSTVVINANVLLATHGETKEEILGGGDASVRYQSFPLKQTPMTYVSAAMPTGGQSTLQVRVNDILWTETDSLYGLPLDDRKYVVRIEDDGSTRVTFNAPIPAGQENVRAKYRKGIGLPGLVKADQLTLLSLRPLGVRSVTNPLAASGAEDPESAASLRDAAPQTGLTLGRLVSLRDYEDFARSFAGFAKAHATITTNGERQEILVTVAPAGGGKLDENDVAFKNLATGMRTYSDPNIAFKPRTWRPAYFQLVAKVAISSEYIEANVLAEIGAALRAAFSFTARNFGQDVTAGEVIRTIQNVKGVVFVQLSSLWKTDPLSPDLAPPSGPPSQRLTADVPEPGAKSTDVQPAEILMLDPRPAGLVVI